MALNHSPRIVTNGLVLCIDPSNRKSSLRASNNSLINSDSWVNGSTSAPTGYGLNQTVAGENYFGANTDPWGNQSIVLETRPSPGDGASADGGWNTSWYNIDKTKLYRFSVWVRRTSSSAGGTFYFGMYGNGTYNVVSLSAQAVMNNPYWDCQGTTALTQNEWQLIVGHVYPYGTTYTGKHPDTGYYRIADGGTKLREIGGCNIGTGDLAWTSDATQALHRSYHYYCSDTTTRLQFAFPRLEPCDGTQPTIKELLTIGDSQLKDISVSANTYNTYNQPVISQNYVTFDGVNDFLLSPSTYTFGNNHTEEAWVYCTQNISTYNMFMGRYIPYFSFYNGNSILYYNAVNAVAVSVSGGSLSLNTWYHVAFTTSYDGANTTMIPYVNGVQVGSGGTYAGTQTDYSYNFMIGDGNNGTNGTSAWYPFKGNIGPVKLYNRALSAAEIRQNFNALRGRFGV